MKNGCYLFLGKRILKSSSLFSIVNSWQINANQSKECVLDNE